MCRPTVPRPHCCPRKRGHGSTVAWGPPHDAEEACLQVVEVAVPCECIVHEGEEVHKAVLTAEHEQDGCRVGGDAPDGAALQ